MDSQQEILHEISASSNQEGVRQRAISCRNCVFAVPFAAGGPTRQVGCRMGRTDHFQEQGCLRDGADGFFEVVGRSCNFQREYPWGEELSAREQEERVRGEVRLKVAAILMVNEGSLEEDVVTTLSSLLAKDRTTDQFVFHEIIVVHNRGYRGCQNLYVRLGQMAMNSGHSHFSFLQMLEPGSVTEALDEGAKAIKEASFYLVTTPGTAVSPSFSSELDTLVNTRAKRFVILTPRGGELNGLTVHVMTHRMRGIGGNRPIEIMDKEGNRELLSRVDHKVARIAQENDQEWAVEILEENIAWKQ